MSKRIVIGRNKTASMFLIRRMKVNYLKRFLSLFMDIDYLEDKSINWSYIRHRNYLKTMNKSLYVIRQGKPAPMSLGDEDKVKSLPIIVI